MKTKHTPGPWAITRTDKEDDFPEVMVGIPDTREARKDYSLNWAGRHVAQVFNQFGEEYDANARLIAAAPDLLEALHRAMPLIGFLLSRGIHKECAAPQDAVATFQQAWAAIKKATGE